MKITYIYMLLIPVVILGCQKPKDYAELSGKITNPNSQQITLSNETGYEKTIVVNSDGTFSDTLKVSAGRYIFTDGNEYGTVYLENGNKTSFTLDTNAFDETLKFKGDDAEKSNVLVKYLLLQEEYLNESIFDQSSEDFENTFENFKTEFGDLKNSYASIDAAYFKSEDDSFEEMKAFYKEYYEERQAINRDLGKGTPSPIFNNYENYAGGTSSLEDFKGRYVYIDVWATWCGPCKKEIPYLKAIEEKFHDRNIEFVSISVDDDKRSGSMTKAKNAWKRMVAEKSLTGVQLLSDNGWETDFIKSYKISGIPRFILIDPKGNIIDPDAPRPSSSELTKLLEELGV